jgi:hypothetical protein
LNDLVKRCIGLGAFGKDIFDLVCNILFISRDNLKWEAELVTNLAGAKADAEARELINTIAARNFISL